MKVYSQKLPQGLPFQYTDSHRSTQWAYLHVLVTTNLTVVN